MNVYSGTDTSSLVSDSHCGSNSPGTITSTHPNGCLTFQWETDFSVTAAVFSADVRRVGGPPTVCGLTPVPTPAPTGLASLEQKWSIDEDVGFE
jgi:hypothetical protein